MAPLLNLFLCFKFKGNTFQTLWPYKTNGSSVLSPGFIYRQHSTSSFLRLHVNNLWCLFGFQGRLFAFEFLIPKISSSVVTNVRVNFSLTETALPSHRHRDLAFCLFLSILFNACLTPPPSTFNSRASIFPTPAPSSQ